MVHFWELAAACYQELKEYADSIPSGDNPADRADNTERLSEEERCSASHRVGRYDLGQLTVPGCHAN